MFFEERVKQAGFCATLYVKALELVAERLRLLQVAVAQ